jgi:hypothetical protein
VDKSVEPEQRLEDEEMGRWIEKATQTTSVAGMLCYQYRCSKRSTCDHHGPGRKCRMLQRRGEERRAGEGMYPGPNLERVGKGLTCNGLCIGCVDEETYLAKWWFIFCVPGVGWSVARPSRSMFMYLRIDVCMYICRGWFYDVVM